MAVAADAERGGAEDDDVDSDRTALPRAASAPPSGPITNPSPWTSSAGPAAQMEVDEENGTAPGASEPPTSDKK